MPNNDYANEPNQSRSEDIIQSILDNTEYDEPARSRIEYLLVELKNAIEGGGGGGGVTSYAPLTEKPKIDNHTLQAGNNTSSDLGLQTKLTFDSAPTESSTNPVTSGGVYTALGTKANSADVYNKSAVDTALGAKADKSTTYTKTEVDTALGSKQNTISDLSTIRSGAALGATAVQPISGKGLSTNDYTNNEKSKLAGIEAQANKTIVDSALSGTSTNPVQNKVVKSALDGKQASLTTAQLAAVNSGITSEKLTQDESNIAWNTNNGVKNIWELTIPDSLPSGFTITKNTDGGYIFNGTAGSSGVVCSTAIYFGTGEYILSGCPAGGSDDTYRLDILRGANTNYCYGDEVKVSGFTTSTSYQCRIRIAPNYTCNNLKFYPMIRPATIEDSTYVPYALSNAELTVKEQVNENNISSLNKYAGGRNLLSNAIKAGSYSDGKVIVSVNSDGTLTVRTTAALTTNVIIPINTRPSTIENGKQYVLSGCPTGGGRGTYCLYWEGSGSAGADCLDSGSGATATPTAEFARLLLIVFSGASIPTAITFKPMICTAEDWALSHDYQPYALSNAAITPALQECVDNGVKNLYDFRDLGATAGSGTGVTLTDNGDGTFAATGTASGANYARYLLKQAPIKAGNYVISGISGGALEAYRLRVGTGSGDAYLINLGNNYAQFTIATDTTITVQFVVNSGVTVTNLSIKPMIITKAMYDAGFTDYQPYALSNAELTAEVKPSAYSNPTPQSTDITLQSGGYYKIGNSVTVCIRATVSNALAAWAPIFSGFPVPITDSSIAENSAVVAVSSNAGAGIGITKRGIMQGFDAIPAGTLLLNCTYLCV